MVVAGSFGMNISAGLNGDDGLLLQLLVKIAEVICKFCEEDDFPDTNLLDLFISNNSLAESFGCQYDDGESILLLISIFRLIFSFLICEPDVDDDEICKQWFNFIFLFDIDLFDVMESFDEQDNDEDDAFVSCCIGDLHTIFDSIGDVFESLFV